MSDPVDHESLSNAGGPRRPRGRRRHPRSLSGGPSSSRRRSSRYTARPLGDVVADSGYAHRVPAHFALPLRAAGASLVMDLHPHDRGMQGTYEGTILWNGNCYCPRTPEKLFELGPLPRSAGGEQTRLHDEEAAELSRYKFGRICADDADGYHRVVCPAVAGKLRCPLRVSSMALSYAHPEVLSPPEHPPGSVCDRRPPSRPR